MHMDTWNIAFCLSTEEDIKTLVKHVYHNMNIDTAWRDIAQMTLFY